MSDELRLVLVSVLLTVCVKINEVLPEKSTLPAYTAVME